MKKTIAILSVFIFALSTIQIKTEIPHDQLFSTIAFWTTGLTLWGTVATTGAVMGVKGAKYSYQSLRSCYEKWNAWEKGEKLNIKYQKIPQNFLKFFLSYLATIGGFTIATTTSMITLAALCSMLREYAKIFVNLKNQPLAYT